MNTKIDENKAQFIKIIFKNLYKNPWQRQKISMFLSPESNKEKNVRKFIRQ